MEDTLYSKPANDAAHDAGSYSPFWALVVLFVTMSFLQVAYLVNDFGTSRQIHRARSGIAAAVAQAQTINQTTEAVGRDLLALAAESPEAARIVAEFKLKVSDPAPSPE